MSWLYVALFAAAAVATSVFVIVELRPDIAARVMESVRGTSASSTAGLGSSMSGTSPATSSAGPWAASGAAAGAKAGTGAASEPPVVSIWSLPVARAGQQPVSAPMQAPAFRPTGVAPQPLPQPHAGFVPSAAFAFNFNAAPPPPVLPVLNPAPSPNVAQAAPAPVEEAPAPKPAPVQRTAPPADEEPAAAPTRAAPPPPPPAPPPPPKPKFAPGSLEDQIQKAVEAEAAKKK